MQEKAKRLGHDRSALRASCFYIADRALRDSFYMYKNS